MTDITDYGFVIDNRRCIGCHACTVACKAEHDDPIGVNKTWVKYIEKGTFPDTQRHFSVMRCNHCADSPCTDVCPVTALYEREDGIVDFDSDRCIGCKACMQGCPYDAIYIDPATHTAAKCNYCSHRVDSGREPACVTVCPEDAILAGDISNPDTTIARTVSREEVQVRKPEKGTEPKLYYVDGDEGSLTPGATAREEHYMWSDAPHHVGTRGVDRAEFDLERAAASLAASDVTLPGARGGAGAPKSGAESGSGSGSGSEGGCGSGSCGCASGAASKDDTTVGDGTRRSGAGGSAGRADRAYELLVEETRRVYDVGEDHAGSWGWEVYAYTTTKAVAAGAVLLPALLILGGEIDPTASLMGASALVALGFLGLTGLLLVLDLDRPERFHWVLLRPNWKSWLVKGAYIITAYGAFLGLLVVAWALGSPVVTHPVVLGVGAVLAGATAVYTAFLFSQSKGRDLWQSPVVPVHMLVQAAVAGAAVLAVLGLVGFSGVVGPAALVLAMGVVVHGVLVGSELFTPHQTTDAETAAARIVRGRYRWAFWAGSVGVGILAPLVLLAVAPVAGIVGGVGVGVVVVAGVLAVGGVFAYEYCWISAPQTISLA